MITPEMIVNHLNSMLVLDPSFTAKVTTQYVKLNSELADSNLIVCGRVDGEYEAGFIGVLNGLLEPLPGNVRIAAAFNGAGRLREFRLVNV